MKILVFILTIFVAVRALSQDKDRDDLNLQILCGFAAQTSKEMQAFKAIVDRNDTVTLRNKLFYGSKLEQILTAITLRYYQTSSSVKLTQDEQKKLDDISKFKDKFSLCFTCTFQQEGTVKHLFYRKNYLASYGIIESFLLNKL